MELYTVEELCETAEDYYRNVEDTSGLLAKPYICMSETQVDRVHIRTYGTRQKRRFRLRIRLGLATSRMVS